MTNFYNEGRLAYYQGLPLDRNESEEWQDGWCDASTEDEGDWMY